MFDTTKYNDGNCELLSRQRVTLDRSAVMFDLCEHHCLAKALGPIRQIWRVSESFASSGESHVACIRRGHGSAQLPQVHARRTSLTPPGNPNILRVTHYSHLQIFRSTNISFVNLSTLFMRLILLVQCNSIFTRA